MHLTTVGSAQRRDFVPAVVINWIEPNAPDSYDGTELDRLRLTPGIRQQALCPVSTQGQPIYSTYTMVALMASIQHTYRRSTEYGPGGPPERVFNLPSQVLTNPKMVARHDLMFLTTKG
jgi:hypothetical protein